MLKKLIYTGKFLQIAGILILLSSAVFSQDRNWKRFSPDTGAWSIFAPGEMKHDPNALETLSTKGGYTFNDSNGFFAVVYEDSAKWRVTIWKPFLGSHYNKVRDGFVRSSKGKLLKDIKFRTKTDNGREFHVKIPDSRILDSEGQFQQRYRVGRFRIFFHGKRCYMLLAVLPEEEINSFAVDNYFDSFVAE